MRRLEIMNQQESRILIERIIDGFEVNSPDHVIRLWLRPIKTNVSLEPNVVVIGNGYTIRGSLCGLPAQGMIFQQGEIIPQGIVYFGYIHPSKFPQERRRLLIPFPILPRQKFIGYIESLEPFKTCSEATRAGA